jgi:hypothetical protein
MPRATVTKMFVSRMYANACGVAMFIASLRTIAWDIYLRFESGIGRRGKNLFYGDSVTGLAFRSMLARTFNLRRRAWPLAGLGAVVVINMLWIGMLAYTLVRLL